ncbi:hypothetical protein JOE26_003574 [Rhodococcus coprophilus]|uniref:Uncharacterized protein n=1 Tax=Rhodococcus coprophilus TaxID=38310 RepID=A0A2X4TP66_9NOCA|nr:hypothetical protein [Rhodococcus coprophilus]SQI28703.1 Uncharacterised protein [Rhodococcus coprophilus]
MARPHLHRHRRGPDHDSHEHSDSGHQDPAPHTHHDHHKSMHNARRPGRERRTPKSGSLLVRSRCEVWDGCVRERRWSTMSLLEWGTRYALTSDATRRCRHAGGAVAALRVSVSPRGRTRQSCEVPQITASSRPAPVQDGPSWRSVGENQDVPKPVSKTGVSKQPREPAEIASKPAMSVSEQSRDHAVRQCGGYRHTRQGSAQLEGEAIVDPGSAGRQRL